MACVGAGSLTPVVWGQPLTLAVRLTIKPKKETKKDSFKYLYALHIPIMGVARATRSNDIWVLPNIIPEPLAYLTYVAGMAERSPAGSNMQESASEYAGLEGLWGKKQGDIRVDLFLSDTNGEVCLLGAYNNAHSLCELALLGLIPVPG